MLRNIRIIPLADESLGVRSMAVYVETSTIRVLLDAGVSLAPKRYGLLPHPAEFEALKEARGRLAEMFLSLAEILNADITRVNVSKGYAVLRLRQLNESAYAIYVPGKGLRVLFERNIDPKERKSFYQEIIEATVRWGLIKEYKGLRQALNKIINIMES